VALALTGEDYSRGAAFTVALLTGMVEPVGGLIGVTAVTLAQPCCRGAWPSPRAP
jgi:ZIP family zinc transporter